MVSLIFRINLSQGFISHDIIIQGVQCHADTMSMHHICKQVKYITKNQFHDSAHIDKPHYIMYFYYLV